MLNFIPIVYSMNIKKVGKAETIFKTVFLLKNVDILKIYICFIP